MARARATSAGIRTAVLGAALLGAVMPGAVSPVAAGEEPTAGQRLASSTWSLAEIDGKAVPRGTEVELTFWPSGRVSGSAGCDALEATWSWSPPDSLFVGPISTTRRACGRAARELEDRFVERLARIASFAVGDGRLAISTDPGGPLVFRSAGAGPGLLFGRWRLVSLDGKPVPEGTRVEVVLGEPGTMSGHGGCNDLSSTFTLDGATIRAGPVLAGRVPCAGDAGRLEDAFVADLEQVARWSVEGTSLTLRDREGKHALELSAVLPVVFRALTDAGWRLARFDDREIDRTSGMTAWFRSDGTLGGSTGCNDYTGTYTVDGAVLTIGQLAATTGRSCPSPYAEEEAAFLEALRTVIGYKLPENQLQLNTTSGSRLTFEGTASVDGVPPVARVIVDAVTGVVWRLADVAGTSVDALPPVTLMFLEDGTVAGVGGCDLYTTPFETDGEQISFALVAPGPRACDEGTLSFQDAYLSLLSLMDRVRLDSGQLVLGQGASDGLRFSERSRRDPVPTEGP